MTFLAWCRFQRPRPDSIGDFARDWVADRDRPRAPSLPQLVEYLEGLGAIPEAVRAGVWAYGEWRTETWKP